MEDLTVGRAYLSWDVGIQNLAYCLIKKTGNTTFDILKWGVIRLGEETKMCTELNKNNKLCTQKAAYTNGLTGGVCKNYCVKHHKTCKNETVTLSEYTDNEKHICKYKIKNNECGKKANYYINDINISFCNQHGQSEKKRLDKELAIKKINKINSNKIPLEIIASRMYENLNNHKDFLTANEVLIENQPSLINMTMKSVSMLLYSYFVIKGMSIDKVPESKLEAIKLINPANKLKVSNAATDKLKDIDKSKNKSKNKLKNKLKNNSEDNSEGNSEGNLENNSENNDKEKNKTNSNRKVYEMTKSLGKKFCKELIKNDKINTDLINSIKKQDDMCDAFLQAYYYIFCSQGVPKDIEIVLNKLVDEKTSTVNEIDLTHINIDIDEDIDGDIDEDVDIGIEIEI
ncbi:MAG: hypothetical protein Terrestrivirus3_66 [Terrestrivirus sp.]|uniref:Holliday junction resolvase n=1 Tax=Terrestrivirus sp. TaxID=2487775 RepID=A0A3G4ZLS5_9VIRU|nr:MAG: hypothetical protein Terrestrivirus3_66 [Terrestrivirus sp.]